MSEPRVLVIDGNVDRVRAMQKAALGYDSGEGYRHVLRSLDPAIGVDIVRPADTEVALPAGVELGDYDGVTITGSALNVYHGGAPVERQVSFLRAVFSVGVPVFGSCWGLQVAVTAAGGTVHRNPHGREFGFAQRIRLNAAGSAHRLYAGKPSVFQAPTVHLDAIAVLPPGATVLATNDMGLQAAEFTCERSVFWGVQYHPEYGPLDIAAAAERYGVRLVEEGLFASEAALHDFVSDLRHLHANPRNPVVATKHSLGIGITDERTRLLELRNWLDDQVAPRVRMRR